MRDSDIWYLFYKKKNTITPYKRERERKFTAIPLEVSVHNFIKYSKE